MAGTIFSNISIKGIAGAVPTRTVPNTDFKDVFGAETVNRFIQFTGIESTRKSSDKQTASDLGFIAADNLLRKLDVDRKEIGALIFCTHSPDYSWPSTAYVLHKQLGLPQQCMAFDVNIGCSGFVYGIHISCSLIQSMKQKYILLLTGEADKYDDLFGRKHPDISTVMMFSAACTATLMERRSNCGEVRTEMYGDGAYEDGFGYRSIIRGGQCRNYFSSSEVTMWSDGIERSINDPYMDGMGVFAFSTREVPKAIRNFFSESCTSLNDYDSFYFHQANKNIVDRIVKKLHLQTEKVPMSLTHFGNTSGASIPLTIIDHLGNQMSDDEQHILCCGFGVGLSWGVSSMYLAPAAVLPLIETDYCFEEGELHPI